MPLCLRFGRELDICVDGCLSLNPNAGACSCLSCRAVRCLPAGVFRSVQAGPPTAPPYIRYRLACFSPALFADSSVIWVSAPASMR